MLAHVTNLRGGSRVIPADKQPTWKGIHHAQHHPQAVSGNPRRRGGTARGGGTGERADPGRPGPGQGRAAAPKPSVIVIDLNDPFFRLASNDTLYARGTQVGSEGVKDNGVPLETVSFTFKGEVIGLEPNALGTQVGSEGVKAVNNLRGEAIDIIPS